MKKKVVWLVFHFGSTALDLQPRLKVIGISKKGLSGTGISHERKNVIFLIFYNKNSMFIKNKKAKNAKSK